MAWRSKSTESRFWAKVDRQGADQCWLWRASINNTGYGAFAGTCAHRVAYELLVGPVPDGLHLDHLCRNRACVNPAHLEPITLVENNRRAARLVTHCRQGHEFTPENIRWQGPNKEWRGCATCHRLRERERQAKARSAM